RKGGSISIDYAQRIYNWAKQKAQIHKSKGIHTLRHCFATHLLEAGVDLVTIKTLLGHNSLQSTQRYLQIRQPKLTATANPLDLLRFPDCKASLPCCLAIIGEQQEKREPSWLISFVVTGRATVARISYPLLSVR